MCRILLAGAVLLLAGAAFAQAPNLQPNRYGCGLNGGPGYRAEDGHCVGARELKRECGDPPETACTFEGSGAQPKACSGCGCKGGPGWRKPNGQCAGFRDLKRACGDPPGAPCTYEITDAPKP